MDLGAFNIINLISFITEHTNIQNKQIPENFD